MTDSVRVFRASTEGLRGGGDLDAFIEYFGRAVLRVAMEPLGGAPLSCEMTIRATPDFAVADGRLSPSRNTHPSSLALDDDLVLVSFRSGNGELRHRGRSFEVGPGDTMLTANAETAVFTLNTPTVVSNLRLRRALLEERGVLRGEAQVRPIAQQASLRLLLNYAQLITDPTLPLDHALARTASSHVHDLAAMILAGGLPPVRAIGAARLLAIRQDIRQSAAQHDLSIATIARRHGISTSYLRRLLAESGTSFSHFLLEVRLSKAYGLLTDTARAGMPISSIAYGVGFNDLSYFNRCFRHRYGASPSEVRARGH